MCAYSALCGAYVSLPLFFSSPSSLPPSFLLFLPPSPSLSLSLPPSSFPQDHHPVGEPEERSRRGAEEGGGNRHGHGRSRNRLPTVPSSLHCLLIHLLYPGVPQSGVCLCVCACAFMRVSVCACVCVSEHCSSLSLCRCTSCTNTLASSSWRYFRWSSVGTPTSRAWPTIPAGWTSSLAACSRYEPYLMLSSKGHF